MDLLNLPNLPALVGERAPTLVGASFHDGWSAERAVAALAGFGEPPAAVIRPGDRAADATIEPDADGIWHTFVRSHLVLGTIGVIGGIAFAGLLILVGWHPAVSSPGAAAFGFACTGGFMGFIAAVVVTLRPDHDWVIAHVQSAQRRGRWSVVVHPRNATEANRVVALLRAAGGGPLRSL